MMHAAFNPAWEQRQPREIVTEWDMVPEPSGRGTVEASAAAFYIADATALPLWQPPNGVFTKGGPVPNNETLTVFAPPDFRMLASGTPVRGGSAKTDNLVSEVSASSDPKIFFPFVVAGRYQEQIVPTPDGSVSFWTFHSLDEQQARVAAARISSSMRAFEEFFGPASGRKTVVHVAEAPAICRTEFGDGNDNPVELLFPNGVLLIRACSQGITNSKPVLQLAEYELARTWFGWRVRPRPEAQILMGRGVGLFGLVIVAERRGQDQRGLAIAALLQQYDEARRVAADRRLLELPGAYSRAERISTGYRAALLFVALEDVCGHDNLRTAFRNIVHARGNDDVGYEDLKAALESASHRDLAEMFRVWMIRPGIPEDFRVRYGNSVGTH